MQVKIFLTKSGCVIRKAEFYCYQLGSFISHIESLAKEFCESAGDYQVAKSISLTISATDGLDEQIFTANLAVFLRAWAAQGLTSEEPGFLRNITSEVWFRPTLDDLEKILSLYFTER